MNDSNYNKASDKKNQTRVKTWVFLCSIAFLILGVFSVCSFAENEKFIEEMNKGEKSQLVRELIREGDQYVTEKNYDEANAVYEQVFQLDSSNQAASDRIDALKQLMVAEGKTEAGLLKSVYDDEAELRIQKYWSDVERFTKEGKSAQARFALEKILLIDPFHAEANRRYREIQKTRSGETT